jgi:hypothetical protein
MFTTAAAIRTAGTAGGGTTTTLRPWTDPPDRPGAPPGRSGSRSSEQAIDKRSISLKKWSVLEHSRNPSRYRGLGGIFTRTDRCALETCDA